MYCFNIRTGQRKLETDSSDCGANTAKENGWLTWKAESLLGKKDGLGHSVTPEPSEFQRKQLSAIERAWSSPTLFAEEIASRNAVLADTHFKSAPSSGSNGGEDKPSKTTGRSHEGTRANLGGRRRMAPFKKRDTKECDPTDRELTSACLAEMAATYTFIVETDRPVSKSPCR